MKKVVENIEFEKKSLLLAFFVYLLQQFRWFHTFQICNALMSNWIGNRTDVHFNVNGSSDKILVRTTFFPSMKCFSPLFMLFPWYFLLRLFWFDFPSIDFVQGIVSWFCVCVLLFVDFLNSFLT